MFEVWDTPAVLRNLVNSGKLQHENDGLIFTVDACPYVPGTCQQILKWKPLELNSIDFKIGEPVHDPRIFPLYCRQRPADILFDFIVADPDHQLKIKPGMVLECYWDVNWHNELMQKVNFLKDEQSQGNNSSVEPDPFNIAEKVFNILKNKKAIGVDVQNKMKGGWKVLRERTDKPANAARVALNILGTIRNPVSQDDLTDVLDELTASDFQEENGGGVLGKRSRSEVEGGDSEEFDM